jgi:hypothetical protein
VQALSAHATPEAEFECFVLAAALVAHYRSVQPDGAPRYAFDPIDEQLREFGRLLGRMLLAEWTSEADRT